MKRLIIKNCKNKTKENNLNNKKIRNNQNNKVIFNNQLQDKKDSLKKKMM